MTMVLRRYIHSFCQADTRTFNFRQNEKCTAGESLAPGKWRLSKVKDESSALFHIKKQGLDAG